MVFVVALTVFLALAFMSRRIRHSRTRPTPIRIPIRKVDQRIPPHER
jgi:hypothetical protein